MMMKIVHVPHDRCIMCHMSTGPMHALTAAPAPPLACPPAPPPGYSSSLRYSRDSPAIHWEMRLPIYDPATRLIIATFVQKSKSDKVRPSPGPNMTNACPKVPPPALLVMEP